MLQSEFGAAVITLWGVEVCDVTGWCGAERGSDRLKGDLNKVIRLRLGEFEGFGHIWRLSCLSWRLHSGFISIIIIIIIMIIIVIIIMMMIIIIIIFFFFFV